MCNLDFQCKRQRSKFRDLQVTLQVTFLSRALYKLEQWFCFVFSNVCLVEEVDGMRKKCVTFMRDLVLWGHATLWVTFPISGTIQARVVILIFSLVSNVLWVKEVDEVRKICVTFPRDLVCTSRSLDLMIDVSYRGQYIWWNDGEFLFLFCVRKITTLAYTYSARDRKGHS